MRKAIFIGTLGLFLLGTCNSKTGAGHDEHDHATEQHDHEAEGSEHEGHDHEAEESHGNSNEIVLTPEKAKAAGVEVSEVQPGTFHQVIKTSGQVLAAQGDERMAVATVAGVVSFRHRVTEGMNVSQGTPLVVLSSNHMAEGDPVRKARVAYEAAKQEYERMEALREDQIVSEKDFTQAWQTYENARISYEAVAKNQSENGQVVTSPIGGYVKSLLVKEGDYVTVGQPMMNVTQTRTLYLKANVPERYYTLLGTLRSAKFKTAYGDRVYDLRQMGGRLVATGKQTGDGSPYIPVTFEFANRADVAPGSFVETYLLTSPRTGVISVPIAALTDEQGLHFVYVQTDASCYERREVHVGETDGERIEIRSGLKGGEKVVVKGATQVRLAGASTAIPGHTHNH